jgi:hypothetical protein
VIIRAARTKALTNITDLDCLIFWFLLVPISFFAMRGIADLIPPDTDSSR